MKSGILIFILFLSSFAFSQFRVIGEAEKLSGSNTFLNPKWSPDGKSIALTSDNYRGIWIYNVASGAIIQLSDEDAAGFGYEWSADSKSILTRTARFDEHKRYNAVKLFDVETKNSITLSDYNTRMPDLPKWSSDNSRIFFYNNGKLEVHNTGKTSLLKTAGQSKQIFITEGKLAIGDIDSRDIKEIDPLNSRRYMNLRVSPDRSKAAFEAYGGNLYVMNTDGSGLTDLGKGYRASWSPDSKYVVYMITEDDRHQYTSSDLYISSADAKEKQQITFSQDKLEMDPDWSPDGSRIIYDDNNEGAVYSITVTKN